eukprot:TRINITY_DN14881_c0_g2_i1.p1 TRINITY_DN14881_c0_g2~~TRINITY_DN14881_c0_g2_i1.p1  ORF type:complete len:100 (-),score=16.97 TRINITY_DN14881_c0_g2_i1:357-656(-)
MQNKKLRGEESQVLDFSIEPQTSPISDTRGRLTKLVARSVQIKPLKFAIRENEEKKVQRKSLLLTKVEQLANAVVQNNVADTNSGGSNQRAVQCYKLHT